MLGEPFRGDFEKKPVRQLKLFLKRVGLTLDVTSTVKIARRKIRSYGFPADLLGAMTRLARSYLEVETRRESAREAARLEGKRRPNRNRKEVEDTSPTDDKGGLLSSSIIGNQ